MLKYSMAATAAAAASLIAGAAQAQATTYTFTGSTYASFTNATACLAGECTTYSTSERPTLTLTFAAPLAANLPVGDRSASSTAYSLSDGVRTTTGPAANAAIGRADFGTDGSGKPTGFNIYLQRTPGPPYTINTPADPNSRVSTVLMQDGGTSVRANYICTARGLGAGAVGGPGACATSQDDSSSSSASSGGMTVTVSTAAATVPTMTEWALILFGTVLAGGAALYIQRRRLAA